jgi:hypothetical protein
LEASIYTLPLITEETSQTLSTTTNAFTMANSVVGQNLAQVLSENDHTKRSTDISLFYGQKTRDTIAACLLIERINNAATIAS